MIHIYFLFLQSFLFLGNIALTLKRKRFVLQDYHVTDDDARNLWTKRLKN